MRLTHLSSLQRHRDFDIHTYVVFATVLLPANLFNLVGIWLLRPDKLAYDMKTSNILQSHADI